MDQHRRDEYRTEDESAGENLEEKAKRKAKEAARETIEEIKVKGGQLIDRVRDIIEEGNARRIIIKKEDRVLIEFPLSAGLGGAAAAVWFAPTLAAIGAIASMVTDVRLVVEREVKPGTIVTQPPPPPPPSEPTL